MELLAGHTAFVTGGTQGVGEAIVRGLADAGARIVVHGLRRDEPAERVIAALRERDRFAGFVEADLSGPMPDCVGTCFDAALACSPHIDLLVNNAGSYLDEPFLDLSFERFDRTMKLNVYAGFLLTQRFARRWVDNGVGGRVLFTGSINGILAEPVHAAYDTSKGAVEMMVRTLSVSLAPLGIRVNGIAPGLFRTPLTEPALRDERVCRWMELHTPNGVVPEPDVCGHAAVYLLSDGACHVHGQMLRIDGGMSVWQQPDVPPSFHP